MALIPAGNRARHSLRRQLLQRRPRSVLSRSLRGDQPAVSAVRPGGRLRRPGDLAPRGLAERRAVHRPDGPPGPRDWENGKFPPAKAEHPVVGVCWYEAVGLCPLGRQAAPHRRPSGRRPAAGPSSSAAACATAIPGATCSSRLGPTCRPRASARPCPSREYPSGATPNGIYQMTGNVWEWLDDPLETIPCAARRVLSALEAHAADHRRGLQHLFPRRSHLPVHHRTGRARPPREHRLPLRRCRWACCVPCREPLRLEIRANPRSPRSQPCRASPTCRNTTGKQSDFACPLCGGHTYEGRALRQAASCPTRSSSRSGLGPIRLSSWW